MENSLRLMFYSHNTLGFGHASRTLSLAWAIYDRMPETSVLWCHGAKTDVYSLLPPNADVIKLPTYTAIQSKNHVTVIPARLKIPTQRVHIIREEILAATVASYRPHILVVDYTPLGKQGELHKSLHLMRSMPNRTILFGMRDILDNIGTTRKTLEQGFLDAIRSYFDHVLIYGDQAVFDTVNEYSVPTDVAKICTQVGYVVNHSLDLETSNQVRQELGYSQDEKVILANFGSGSVAGKSFLAVLAAWEKICSPDADELLYLLLVLGPYADPQSEHHIRAEASRLPRVKVIGKYPWLIRLMKATDLFIGTSSYNLTAEVMATGSRSLFIPRIEVDDEQLLRAQRMEPFGCLTLLPPVTSDDLAQGILQILRQPKPTFAIDLDGAAKFAVIVEQAAKRISPASWF